MNDIKTYNTIYVECHNEIWDYYFKLNNLIYKPRVIVGEERQREFAQANNIEFFTRTDFNNLNVKISNSFNGSENKILEEILNNKILNRMYYRNSFDDILNENTFNNLTSSYAKIWFSLISEFKLEALILHEMPHLPYTFIGYLIFQKLELRTIFSATLRFKGKTYFVDRIDNYSLFSGNSNDYLINYPNNDNSIYFKRLLDEFGFNNEKTNSKKTAALKIFLVYFRNFIFPQAAERLRFKVIRNGKFIDQSDRIYYYLIIKRMIKKYLRKKFYQKITSEIEDESKIKVFFALHFEPELAVYPLAGENFDQFEKLLELSENLGETGIIYVKEHPWMFDYSKIKSIIRAKKFYTSLLERKNVRFIDINTNIDLILNKIDIIATLTGTIGWEVFFKQMPVLYFGHPWFAGLPGSKKYSSDLNLIKMISDCKNEYSKADYKKIYETLTNTLQNVSVKLNNLSSVEYAEKATMLKNSLESFQN